MSVRHERASGLGTEARSFGTVVASAVEGLRALARQHIQLAKLEVAEAASVRAQGVGMIAAAAVVVMYAIGFVAAALAAALALLLPAWGSTRWLGPIPCSHPSRLGCTDSIRSGS